MQAKLFNLEKKIVGEVSLNERIFSLSPRIDIINRVINWQRSKSRKGTHLVKTVGEVSGSTRKPFKQKGTGRARQGNSRAVQIRGGGIAHGPVVRSYDTRLQKKVRNLGLKHALSAKFASGELYFIDNIKIVNAKTKELVKLLSSFGKGKFFIIDGQEVDKLVKIASVSIPNTNIVPVIGANVYDIIKSDYILMSQQALLLLEQRLK